MTDWIDNYGLTSGTLAACWPSFVTLLARSRMLANTRCIRIGTRERSVQAAYLP